MRLRHQISHWVRVAFFFIDLCQEGCEFGPKFYASKGRVFTNFVPLRVPPWTEWWLDTCQSWWRKGSLSQLGFVEHYGICALKVYPDRRGCD